MYNLEIIVSLGVILVVLVIAIIGLVNKLHEMEEIVNTIYRRLDVVITKAEEDLQK